MRSRLALVTATGLLLTLAACSPAADGDSGTESDSSSQACEAIPSGEASDSIEVSGELGAKPEVTFDAPLEVEETERTVIIEGDGRVAEPGATVTAELTLFDAETGDEVITTEHDGSQSVPITLDDSVLQGFVKAIECSTEGSRVAAVLTAEDGYADQGNQQLGVEAGAQLVLVADVVSVPEPALERAEGEPQEAPAGLPTVELADNGQPTITVPDAAAPTELQIETLIQGDGEEVQDGDTVTVHYTGVIWDSNEVFDSSWERGEPASFPTDGVIPGFSKALVGQQVGSQVIAVIPPSEGYGEQGSGDLIKGDSVLVFVVDILGTN